MASLSEEERRDLLRSLDFDAGRAETEPGRIGLELYPNREHLRALEPEIALIVGARGAGKTTLHQACTDPLLRAALFRRTTMQRAGAGPVEWRTGYPLQAGGPDARAWQAVAARHRHEPQAIQDLWLASLVLLISDRLDAEGQAGLAALLQTSSGHAEGRLAEVGMARPAALDALDRLDAALQIEGAWLFVAYDDLERLSFSDWDAVGQLIRGLVSFWADAVRRWRRIRPKIFLRTDLYRRCRDAHDADLSRFAARVVELSWSDGDLYGALIKRAANTSEALLAFCRQAGVELEPHDLALGWIPSIRMASNVLPFVERLAGRFMGANFRKGHTFTWILDHLRDGNGKASPRSLALLIELAARIERERPPAGGTQLLSPISLRSALDQVSEWYVDQAKRSELRWLDGVAQRLQTDGEVPWERRDLERLLRAGWDKSWASEEGVRPPADSPRELVDALVELGILRERGSELFDVPDLFLAGLKLVRRGGVRRR